MLKIVSGCSMLAEIVRNSFTGRDLSELCRHISRVAIFNPSHELYLLGGANDLFRENQDRIMINSLAKTALSLLIRTRQITFHTICINFQVVFFENNFREFGTLDAVCEEVIKANIFIESRQENF